jgi:hypothetical protein
MQAFLLIDVEGVALEQKIKAKKTTYCRFPTSLKNYVFL